MFKVPIIAYNKIAEHKVNSSGTGNMMVDKGMMDNAAQQKPKSRLKREPMLL